jgi:hypothetical protein
MIFDSALQSLLQFSSVTMLPAGALFFSLLTAEKPPAALNIPAVPEGILVPRWE